jgi:hypothetical protein
MMIGAAYSDGDEVVAGCLVGRVNALGADRLQRSIAIRASTAPLAIGNLRPPIGCVIGVCFGGNQRSFERGQCFGENGHDHGRGNRWLSGQRFPGWLFIPLTLFKE